MPKIMIVEARFYEDIADELVKGAIAEIQNRNADYERFSVAGAFEIPAAISIGHASGKFDGYIALGCVIRGETSHYDYVCGESARGLMDLTVQRNLAIGNGILTVENRDQAWERASVEKKNKGRDVAIACLGMIALKSELGIA